MTLHGNASPNPDAELPDKVQEAIDRVVAGWTRDRIDLQDIRTVTQFLEDLADGGEIEGDPLGVFLSPYSAVRILDAATPDAVGDHLGLDQGERPTRDEVNEYLESVVEQSIDDADVSYGFSAHAIEATDGDVLFLVSCIKGYSFSGVNTSWYGPYADTEEFLALLRKARWLEAGDSPRDIPSRVRQRVRAGTHDVRVHALKLPDPEPIDEDQQRLDQLIDAFHRGRLSSAEHAELTGLALQVFNEYEGEELGVRCDSDDLELPERPDRGEEEDDHGGHEDEIQRADAFLLAQIQDQFDNCVGSTRLVGVTLTASDGRSACFVQSVSGHSFDLCTDVDGPFGSLDAYRPGGPDDLTIWEEDSDKERLRKLIALGIYDPSLDDPSST